jgi:tRNA A37 N6-isopentenylltransferase MiaA
VINAEEMQIFAGLDIITNKVSVNPHHLIGVAPATLLTTFSQSLATATANSNSICKA